jgi:hypothetical protein
MEEDEVGSACGTRGVEDVQTGFWWGKLREKENLKDLSIDGRIILK